MQPTNGFLSSLKVELINPTSHTGGGTWRTLAPLLYIDRSGKLWEVPAEFETDFASVPRIPLAYMFFGCTAHQAAVLHDWFCVTQIISRSEADKLFLEAMESVGVSKMRALPMFIAVRAYYEIIVNFFRGLL